MNGEITYISVKRLHPHPDNPRKDLGDLTELAASIKENGIFQNLTVVDDDPSEYGSDYTVIIGHRRLAAAKLAGLTELPCVIAEMTPAEQVQTMLLENMQRSDLTVYEQAQGFQMMLDFGFTVEEVAEKSGFSQATVRRRVKMMELDQKTLKKVSARQLSLGDFDSLAQIEDIKERNEVLKSIGTNEFEMNLGRVMREQKARQNKPVIEAWLKSVGAKELKQEDKWSSAYEGYPGLSYYIYFADWGEKPDSTPPEKIEGEIFYWMDHNSLRLYKKVKKVPPVRKSKDDQAKEQAIREAWKALGEVASLAYDLRKQFIEKLTVTSKNREAVLRGALYAHLLEAIAYNGPDRYTITDMFGIETNRYDDKREEKLYNGIGSLNDHDLPVLIYALYGDDAKQDCSSSYKSSFPEFRRSCSIKLEVLYHWQVSLGYEMSTEERQLLDGSHEAFKEVKA